MTGAVVPVGSSEEECRCGHTKAQHDWAYDECCSGSGPTEYGCGCTGFTTEPASTIEEIRASLSARSGGAQDDGLRARVEALAEADEERAKVPPGGEQLREALLSTLVRKGVWPLAVAEVAADALLPLIEEQGRRRAAEAERCGYERGRRDFQFAPEGDNHHNAALCPYCSPAAALAPENARPE